MLRNAATSLVLALFASPLLLVGCSSTSNGQGTGGTSATGGTTSAGGTAATGGTTKASGTSAAGGTAAVGGTSTTSGTSAVGGTAAVGGTGTTTGTTTVGGTAAVGGTGTTIGTTTVGGTAAVGGTGTTIGTTTVGGTAAVGGTGTTTVGGTAAVGGTGTTTGTTTVGGTAAVGGTSAAGGASGGTTSTTGTGTTPGCTETTKFSGGDVTSDRLLTAACSPYLITDDIYLDGNATLTIEPGVTLKFDTGIGFRMGYNGAAKLVAVGTAAAPIVFTSAVSSPAAGDWSGLALWDGTMGGTTIAYATVEYCGASNGACIQGSNVKPGRVSIDHVTIAHVGAGANGIQESNDANFAISNSTISDILATPTQQYAISVPATSFAGIDSTNVFNGGAMIEIAGDTVSATTTWKNPGTPIAVTSSLYLDGTPAPVLTIAPGSIFKFANDTEFRVGYSYGGNLKAIGTQNSPITFTSLDESPAPGSWEGIAVWDKATLQYVTISYAGSSYGGVAVSNNTTLDIENSTLSNNLEYGISISCGSTATVTNLNNTFSNNGQGNVGPGPDGVTCQ